jgi:hypothetical protein
MARVCLIRQGYHPLDTRVRREVDALTAAGHEVDVICARRPGQRYRDRLGGVTVVRLPLAAAEQEAKPHRIDHPLEVRGRSTAEASDFG